MRTICVVCLAAAMLSITPMHPAHAAKHPMDPLSGEEIAAAVEVLQEAGNVDGQTRYPMIRLYEMPKADVLAWQPGAKVQRRAEVFAQAGVKIFRATVDLDHRQVDSWKEVTSGKPPFNLSEVLLTMDLTKSDARWQASMKRRGITELNKVVCLPFTVGYFGDDSDRGRQLYRMASYYPHGAKNYWGRMIEGVTVLVDISAKRVLDVIDTGVKPMPAGPVDYDRASNEPLRQAPNPVTYVQEDGPSYSFDGNVIRWDKWSFHLSFEPQSGLVLSDVSFVGRSVLYQAAVSELFVPYMDPDEHWFYRTFMDAGEYGLGLQSSALMPGIDCPENATLLSPILANSSGGTQVRKNAVGVYERYDGDPAWRHVDDINGQRGGVRFQQLVVRGVSTVGNYDYLFDWIFDTSGGIRVRVGATGICSAKAVDAASAAEGGQGDDAAYGRFVDDHTVAVNHDHYIAYRLDFDVDGPTNSFVKDVLSPVRFTGETPRRSGWKIESVLAKTENDAKLVLDQRRPALWRVVSNDVTNQHGYPTSFHIKPTTPPFLSLLDNEDWPQKRAGFAAYNLFVTPFQREERYAGGVFPNQSRGDDGLHVWSAADRPIENTDIVAWYVVGFHHVVRAEDWPVMPTAWHDFYLRPFDFLDRNPQLDLQR